MMEGLSGVGITGTRLKSILEFGLKKAGQELVVQLSKAEIASGKDMAH